MTKQGIARAECIHEKVVRVAIERGLCHYCLPIPGLEPDMWSNDACRGYVIMAMQDCGFSREDIRRVVRQLYEVFDFHTISEAEQKYYSGDY